MIKREELVDPQSCMSRADESEMTFVLLARDKAAPHAIRFWCDYRIALGKNRRSDHQIVEALKCAEEMERQRQETDEMERRGRDDFGVPF